ncbi:type II secretion system protein [Crocinitomix catalasitica]|uniref:type II secretion system protein n=1 Tax=Crocinitomix catalasitica TaxID=184607 RepID=UPI0004836D9C|nr:type II secretion system protein [Crocinitomix catalasitica]
MAQLNWISKRSKHRRLNGFTMLESLVAITILSVLVWLGSAVYSNVLKSEDPMVFHQALLEVDRCHQRLTTEKEVEDKLFEYGSYTIKQEIEVYKNKHSNGLYKVTYSVADNYSNELYTENHLMIFLENAE